MFDLFRDSFPQINSEDQTRLPPSVLSTSQHHGDSMRTARRFVQSLATVGTLLVCCNWVFAQKDPGVRGGIQNTGGGLQQQGIPIPHPPVISPNPTTGATINDNELKSFLEGILRAAQLESSCYHCADTT